MINFEKIENLLGYLLLNEDGAVLGSGGDLENDERIANIVHNLITLSDTVDPAVFPPHSAQKISIDFEEVNYTACLSNKKIYVVKRRAAPSGSLSTESKDLMSI